MFIFVDEAAPVVILLYRLKFKIGLIFENEKMLNEEFRFQSRLNLTKRPSTRGKGEKE